MYLKGFGEHIVDILTLNPELSGVSTASSILDTSNYTFKAITFGKDADGFKNHAHVINSSNNGIYNDGRLRITVYNSDSPSSYHSSATKAFFSSTYDSSPNYPNFYDSRLERDSTVTNITSGLDLGHYTNPARSVDSSISSLWNVIGGFSPSSQAEYRMYSPNGNFITSGYLASSFFNTFNIMDTNGFLKFNSTSSMPQIFYALNVTSVSTTDVWEDGALVTQQTLLSNALSIWISIQTSDLACLAAFGGINHIGVWVLDIRKMLSSGRTPPYSWDPTNPFYYKLAIKKTFLDDLLFHKDYNTNPGFHTYLANSGFIHPTSKGPMYIFDVKFT